MSAYTNLAPYLQIGHPKENANETTTGNLYLYRGPTATLNTNKPSVGATWGDGRPVTSSQLSEFAGSTPALSELVVVTSAVSAISSDLGTAALEKTVYGLRWRPVQRPLDMHPKFRTGGTYALDAAAYEKIIGWKAEQDPGLKKNYTYRRLDSFGVPGALETVTGNALVFCQMLAQGVEEYIEYSPVWRKRGIYRGSNPPTAGVIGLVDAAPSGCPAALTSVYKFVKSNDEVESVGSTTRWRRDEEWEGAINVWADRTNVYPSGDGTTT